MAKARSASRNPAGAKAATNGSVRRGGRASLHERRLALLAELGQFALSGLDLTSIMEKALAATAEGLEVQDCAIGEVLPNGKALVLRATRGRANGGRVDESAAASVYSLVDGTFVDFVLNTDAPVVVGDLGEETRFRVRQSQLDSGIVSRVATVIQGLAQPYGLLGASSNEVDKFSAEDAHFLQAIANILGDAVRHHRSGEEADLLMTLTQVISNAEDFNAALRAAVERVGRSGNWAYGEAWVPDEKANLLRCSKPWSVNVEALADFRQLSERLTCPLDPADYCLPGRIWSSRKPEWIVDVSIAGKGLFTRAPEAAEAGLKAALGVPVCHGNEVVAILVFLSSHARREDGQHVELVSTVASHLASLLKRRLAEQRLQESNATNMALVSGIPDMLFRMARDGMFLDFVPGTMAAPPVDPEKFLGKRVSDVLPEPQASRFMHAIERVLAAGGTQQLAYELDYEGKVHYYEARLSRCAPDEALLMVRDVTEQHETEQALRESEEHYRSLFMKTPIMLHSIAEDGRLLAVNERWLEVLGYTEEEVLGRKSVEFLTEESRETAAVNLPKFWKEGSAHDVPYQLVKKNGEIVDVQLSAVVERDAEGNSTHQFAVLNDVTEHKKADEALRETEEWLKLAQDAGRIGTYDWDIEKATGKCSAQYFRLFGMDPSPSVSLEEFIERIHEDDLKRVEEKVANSLEHGAPDAADYRVRWPDGSTHWISDRAKLVKSDEGRPVRFLGAITDFTERKRLEKELQQAREELEGRVERQMVRGNPYRLTFREFTVLHHVADGDADKEIAAKLGISPLTVHKHVSNLLAKMDASSRTEAGTRAVREGLLA